MRRPSLHDDRGGVDAPIAITATVLVVCLLIVAGISLGDIFSGDDDAIKVAETDDEVAVDYIGTYDNGWVFDTSLWEVADDPEVPKSFTFDKKEQSEYNPMELTIGEGRLLAGFESAIEGLAVNESTTVTLNASEGYGEVPSDELVTVPVQQELALRETMNLSEFEDRYGEQADAGKTVSHPVHGWDVTVEVYSPAVDEVTVKNLPTVGEKYWSYGDSNEDEGWDVKVLNMNSSKIIIENQVSSSMANSVKGVDSEDETFYLHEVSDGQMQFKYAEERVGQNLTFTITLVEFIS